MAHKPLQNYLRRYRRRTTLSQDDVAFLMGAFCGTSVSRHERNSRQTAFLTALAYECIYGIAVADLFEGEIADIRAGVMKRAEKLRESLHHRTKDRNRHHKIRHLTQLLAASEVKRAA